MRGTDRQQSAMFSYISAERRVPQDHPLRPLRAMADAALKQLELLLQVLYTVRSERLLMLQLPVPLVRGTEPRRPGVGCDGVQQESGALAGGRSG